MYVAVERQNNENELGESGNVASPSQNSWTCMKVGYGFFAISQVDRVEAPMLRCAFRQKKARRCVCIICPG
jgi:hypothetical protein